VAAEGSRRVKPVPVPSKTPEARIRPELLTWARTSLGLPPDLAAKKIGVTPERLLSWESGDARPTVAQLRTAAQVYKRPLAVFYLPEVPKDFQPLRDFRRLPDSEKGKLSPELHATIRRAHFQRDAALELRELTDEPVAQAPRVDGDATDPEAFGDAARALLNIDLAVQISWRDQRKALGAWIEALEDLDVLVLQAQRVEINEMRGFSISEPELPVIVLNGADSPRARIFTLLHEYAHLLTRSSGVCDLHERATANANGDVEVLCNEIAAAVLLPREALLAEPALANAATDGTVSDETLRVLSERYSVSREVVLRRLFTLGRASWAFLQSKSQELKGSYERARDEENAKRKAATKPGGPSFYVMRLRDFGKSYVSTALDAYHQDAISSSEFADFLQVKVNRIPSLEAELTKGVVAD
jgi:Zn-dependent peptidase ImmA (M78 family)